MTETKKIVEKLKTALDDELWKLELDLFGLIYDKKEKSDIIEIFLVLSNWVGLSLRDGVWTFYEYTSTDSIEKVRKYLITVDWNELVNMYELGIHDYHNEIYLDNYNYPEEWIEESEVIDKWIFENEIEIYRFLKNIIIENESIFAV